MAARKELLVVVLDVGEHMSQYQDLIKKSTFNLVQEKILHHATHEVGLVLFGTTGTKNALHDEMVEKEIIHDQFMHITVLDKLGFPRMERLREINEVGTGRGTPDYVNALMVGIQMIKEEVAARKLQANQKRIAMISSFDYEVEDLDEDIRANIVNNMHELHVKLQVIGAADPGASLSSSSSSSGNQQQEAIRFQNISTLQALAEESQGGSYRGVPGNGLLAGLFKAKEVMNQPKYYDFAIDKERTVQVRMIKKVGRERLPSLKNHYQQAAEAGGSGDVKMATEHRPVSDLDVVLEPEEMAAAFKYGKNLVPVNRAAEGKVKCPKALELVGFTTRDKIPRWYYTESAYVIIPVDKDKDASGASCQAISALAHALHKTGKLGVVRYVLRNDVSPHLGALEPLLATRPEHCDALVCCPIPFADDLRNINLPSLAPRPDKPQLTPTGPQLAAMQHAVNTVQLASLADTGSSAPPVVLRELLNPRETPNPVLQRFLWFVGQRQLDPGYQLQPAEDDEVAAAVLDFPVGLLPTKAAAALAQLGQHFKTQAPQAAAAAAAARGGSTGPSSGTGAEAATAEGAAAAAEGGVGVYDPARSIMVHEVGTAQPKDDFELLVKEGQVEKAVTGMQRAIRAVVDDSVLDRSYPKALDCLKTLRSSCIALHKGADFNTFLEQLQLGYKQDSSRAGFWGLVVSEGVGPVHSGEDPSVGLSPADAEGYMRMHAPQTGAAAAVEQPAEVEEMEEDEFAGME